MDERSTAGLRRYYAQLVTARAGLGAGPVRDAFAAVPRERFLGPGPWLIFAGEGYVETPTADPAFAYQDVVIALSPAKRVNNGEPSLHARCLAAAAPRPGERVLHIGVGSGYYTAILAALVAPGGTVEAVEIDQELAEIATRNLAALAGVTVRCRSGTAPPLPPSDVIYMNAGASAPLGVWLDSLKAGGRLIFPLTPGWGFGAMLMVTRQDAGFAARFVCRAQFIPSVGGQDEATSARLEQAFAGGDWQAVRTLHRDGSAPDDTCWVAGDDWWLSTRPLG